MRFLFAGAAALLLLPFLAFAQRASFRVGTATAAAGQKANGYIEVQAGVDAATNIPVVVVNGAKPGPVLALVTGAHGTEYVSIIAVEKLIGELDPAQVSGTVILLRASCGVYGGLGGSSCRHGRTLPGSALMVGKTNDSARTTLHHVVGN